MNVCENLVSENHEPHPGFLKFDPGRMDPPTGKAPTYNWAFFLATAAFANTIPLFAPLPNRHFYFGYGGPGFNSAHYRPESSPLFQRVVPVARVLLSRMRQVCRRESPARTC